MIDDILNDTNKLIFTLISFVIVVDIITSFAFYINTKKFLANSRSVNAKISNIETSDNVDIVHFSFKDMSGKRIETSTRTAPKKYNEGDNIELLYHKDKPEKVKTNSPTTLWLLPRIILSGAVFMVFVLTVFHIYGTCHLTILSFVVGYIT